MRKNILLICILVVISAVFLCVFSYSTSPIYNLFGYDSAIFMVVGKSMTAGKALYSDIFDHKGPLLFLIEYLGWLIGGKQGIFILQVINLTISLFIAHRIWGLFGFARKSSYIPIIGLLLLLHFSNNEGNQSEEYSLVFLLLPLSFGIKFLLDNSSTKHPPAYSFVYGACFAIIAFNRITNAAPIAAMCLGIALYLIVNKEWVNLAKNALYLISGIASVCLLVCSYFWIEGRLYDMIYATFIFNFKYSNAVGGGSLESLFMVNRRNLLWFLLRVTPGLLLLITSIIYYIKTKNAKLLITSICISFFTYWAASLGLRAGHYMTVNAVPLTLGLALWYKLLTDKKLNPGIFVKLSVSFYIVCMFATFLYIGKIILTVFDHSQCMDKDNPGFYYYTDKQLVSDMIKGDDRNSVFGYNLHPAWYIENDIIPPYKYFVNQESWIKSDSLIYYGIKNYLETTPPKWIVIPTPHTMSWLEGVDGNPILKNLLEHNYMQVGSDINQIYYKLK